MFEFLYKGLTKALESCDQAEIYGEQSDIMTIDLEREEVKKMKHVRGTGIGVRVIIAKKIGFSYTTAVEDRKIEECVAHAITQARVSEQDEYFTSLPTSRQTYKKPEKTIDKQIVELLRSGSEDAIRYCTEMLAGMWDYKLRRGIECRPTEGSFAAALDETYIINSEGIETHNVGTYVSAGLTVVASEDGGEEVPGYESEVRRMLADINFGWIGREAVRIAAESLGGRGLKTRKLPVVFSPRALQSLFAYTLIPQLSAENVQRKQSPYHGRMGELIASEMLMIVDDGTMPAGVNSRRMDGEGVPSQSTTLVEEGILKNFLYDSYTAAKDRVESTGNAVRSFDNLPTPGSTNFILKGSGASASKDEILAEIPEGLFITDVIGAHTASRASGDFSVVAQNAFGIKKGDLFPVKHVMIAGNMQELLKHIELLGTDTRQIYNLVSPSLKVSEMQVIA
ncbi:MAG: TldD/PmbA family protein [Methanophagales archaeon ANME-1-THS]|nr:MAG: TldD/PmbA family protein [Methanophagales archaeon ANME-1-THS]